MARTLQDFVDAAVVEHGRQSEDFKAWRLLVQKVVASMRIRGKLHIAEIADDVIEELEYLEKIPPQSKRKTTRYFPRPKRFADEREEYISALAKRFIATAGRAQSRSKSPKTKGDWVFQEERAREFLELREQYNSLKYSITIDEFMAAVRSLNSQKGTQTRLQSKRSKRKAKAAAQQPIQLSLL